MKGRNCSSCNLKIASIPTRHTHQALGINLFFFLFNVVIISCLAQLNALYVCRRDKFINLLNCEMLKYANIFVTALTFFIFKKYIR